MESKSKSEKITDKTYVNTNPFASKRGDSVGAAGQPTARDGKRPRILKPVYSVRLF